MRNYRVAKAMAKTMRDELAQRQIMITHSDALEMVARQFGLANWNILSAQIGEGETSKTGEAIIFHPAVPIIRIFDVEKANEFYLGFLGFKVDWDHRYGDNYPLYMQISRAGLKLHLSEHAGDASPGSTICVYMKGIHILHRELKDADYRYMKPEVQQHEDRLELHVTDPFSNRIRFFEHPGS